MTARYIAVLICAWTMGWALGHVPSPIVGMTGLLAGCALAVLAIGNSERAEQWEN